MGSPVKRTLQCRDHSEGSGNLLRQNYRDGFFVKKGQLLYEIDPRAFEVAIAQSKAQVAVAVANLSNAQTNVARDRPLAAQSAIPQKQLDTDIATQAANQAQLDAAKAQLAQSDLNLSWTRVYSPINGIAGVSAAQVGNLVGTSTTMTTVSQVNPIWAYFSISESDYLTEAQKFFHFISGQQVASPVLEFIQANGTPNAQKGRIVLVNRQVTSQTGTIQLVAELPNADAVLRPGGFGRVRFQTSMNEGALLVPQAAVIEVQSIYQVAIVNPDNKASFRMVQVGSRKNAILIVEFAKGEFDNGKSLLDASLAGAKLRLRPILMTAFAFILGCVPLWIANGAGAVSRRVLGTAVIGGMLAASLIAIFFIPVSFDVVEKAGLFLNGEKPPPEIATESGPAN